MFNLLCALWRRNFTFFVIDVLLSLSIYSSTKESADFIAIAVTELTADRTSEHVKFIYWKICKFDPKAFLTSTLTNRKIH